tara:strand:+ start:9768 stop:10355 length:588 start_codon:yes stop_codon:yes gene_type:complete
MLVAGTPMAAALDYTLAPDHAARVMAVQKSIDFACNSLEANRNALKDLGEDAITLQICQMMKMTGIQAEHDAHVGGHCDIVVRGADSFLWLAEAKIHNSYSWLDKGFKQLSRRYSTGVYGQDHADILVYCFAQNAAGVLETWRQKLHAFHDDVQTENSPCGNPMLFVSKHQHAGSGLVFHTRHKVVALYWEPIDT